MNRKFEIKLLSKKFYETYSGSKYNELLQKEKRPYLVLLIELNKKRYAIPFRSYIKHKYGYKLTGYKNKKNYKGLDFTKTVIIKSNLYIGGQAYIDKQEFKKINSEFNLIIRDFKKFLIKYSSLTKKNNININRNF